MDLRYILIGLGIVLVALTVHEAAHAWTSNQLGDPTARLLGRISLNPIVHIDPIGTILLPLISAYSGLPIIGWAKPVPVDTRRLKHPRRDFMIVAAAGPISNLAQAVICAVIVRSLFADTDTGMARAILLKAVEVNVLLAVFNLIPIPPLDGGNVLAGLVPESAAVLIDGLRQYGFILLYALMLTGILDDLIEPPAYFLLGLLL